MKSLSTQRFLALDVFRGMTVCFMIVVNTQAGAAYSPLRHADWHGFTPTDLVFPSFLFAVGNAMSFVMPKWQNKPQTEVLWRIFKRTAIIFLLGYLMYWFPFFRLDQNRNISLFPFSETRIFGVLQRIALCYGFAALMVYYLKPKMLLIISGSLLLLYWFIMIFFGDSPDPLSMLTNAGVRLDVWLIGQKHLYWGEGVAFDPEGLLGTLPAIVNVVAGYLAGKYVQEKGKTYEGLTKLLLAGFTFFIIAYFWNLVFPINKKLWTSSYVLHTIGLDCMILCCIMYIIDFRQKARWAKFFEPPGKNPLVIYLFSELFIVVLYMIPVGRNNIPGWVYQNIFRQAGDMFGSLLFSLTYMMICWSLAYWMNRKKIYIKV